MFMQFTNTNVEYFQSYYDSIFSSVRNLILATNRLLKMSLSPGRSLLSVGKGPAALKLSSVRLV